MEIKELNTSPLKKFSNIEKNIQDQRSQYLSSLHKS